ncbi:MAG: stalk domain-containing protein [Fimbriimonas sp.]
MANLLKHFVGLALVSSALLASAQTVSYNGSKLSFDDNDPYMSGGTVMLPARDTLDRINGLLERNESGKRLDLLWNSNRAVFRQGDRFFTMGGKRFNLPTTSQARGGVLYLPLELFAKLTNGKLTRGGGGGGGGGDKGNQIFFDDRKISLTGNLKPYRKQGVMMVPFRQFGDAIGASTDRTADGKRVTINFGSDKIVYDKGHTWYRYNGDRIELSTISEDRGGVLFVPITMYRSVTRGRVTLG